MKKSMFLAIVFLVLMSSGGICAVPDPSTGIGDFQFGYNYYNLKKMTGGVEQGNNGFNELFGSFGIGFGYGVFINQIQAGGESYTDVGLKTVPLLPNASLMLGQRRLHSDTADSGTSFFGGVSVKQDLAAGVGIYASYQKGTHFYDKALGLTYDLENNVNVNLGWRKLNDLNGTTFEGFGSGVYFKF